MSNHKKKEKKTFYGRTDRRKTQNFSSKPHIKKIEEKKNVFYQDRQTDF